MLTVEHLNAGWIQVPNGPRASCHCLVVRDGSSAVLVDTGIGLADVRRPAERIGQALIDAVGFQFNEADTAIRQLAARGIAAGDVRHLILTHLDPDHAGGLADFPAAAVHVSAEELAAVQRGDDPRYLPIQFAHGPKWQVHGPSGERWFDFEARRLDAGLAEPLWLIPLFGHTAGQCGVAIPQGERWLLHVGDAYYLRAELTDPNHPVDALAAARAADDRLRRATLDHLRQLARNHPEVDLVGYHDISELPETLR